MEYFTFWLSFPKIIETTFIVVLDMPDDKTCYIYNVWTSFEVDST